MRCVSIEMKYQAKIGNNIYTVRRSLRLFQKPRVYYKETKSYRMKDSQENVKKSLYARTQSNYCYVCGIFENEDYCRKCGAHLVFTDTEDESTILDDERSDDEKENFVVMNSL